MSIRLPHSCFVHVPRTGGTWLQNVLTELNMEVQVLTGDVDSHFTYRELPEFWKRLSSFSFVRHPLDWAASRWSHAVKHDVRQKHRHYGIHRIFDEMVAPTFEQTILNILKFNPGLISRTFELMQDGVEYLIRTEDFPTAVHILLHQLEGISYEDLSTTLSIPACNGTSEEYREQLILNPFTRYKFLKSEQQIIDVWSESAIYNWK